MNRQIVGDADKAKPSLEERAATGDRNAIRTLRLAKLSQFAEERLVGDQRPDANGRTPNEPWHQKEEKGK